MPTSANGPQGSIDRLTPFSTVQDSRLEFHSHCMKLAQVLSRSESGKQSAYGCTTKNVATQVNQIGAAATKFNEPFEQAFFDEATKVFDDVGSELTLGTSRKAEEEAAAQERVSSAQGSAVTKKKVDDPKTLMEFTSNNVTEAWENLETCRNSLEDLRTSVLDASPVARVRLTKARRN